MLNVAAFVTEQDPWIETFAKLVELFPLLQQKSSVEPSIL